jgi:hypothetical protein
MTNDLCVQNRDNGHPVADWIDMSKIHDCPQFVTNNILPGPYNYWPFIIWGSVGCFVALCVTIIWIVETRSETRKAINAKLVDAGLPDLIKRVRSLEHYTGKVLTDESSP